MVEENYRLEVIVSLSRESGGLYIPVQCLPNCDLFTAGCLLCLSKLPKEEKESPVKYLSQEQTFLA
jgi:hypothetical protein